MMDTDDVGVLTLKLLDQGSGVVSTSIVNQDNFASDVLSREGSPQAVH
jgi:hypothetical protein